MSRRGKLAFVVLALFVALFGAGCADREEGDVALRDWTLVTASGTSEVTLPAHLDAQLPRAPPVAGARAIYTLRTHVALPVAFRGQSLTLAIINLPAIATLRVGGHEGVDGHEAVALDPAPFDRYRSAGPHRWRVVADDTRSGALDLALEVEDTWVSSGWIDSTPTLSATPFGDPRFVFVKTFNQVTALGALVTMLLVSFLYGAIFVLGRNRTVHAWHAFQGIFAAAYPALVLGYSQPLLGTADVGVGAIAIGAAAVCSVHFISLTLGQERPSPAWWLLLVVMGVAAVTAPGPFRSAPAVAPVVVLTLVAVSIYGVHALVKARRAGPLPLGGTFAALAFPITIVLGAPDAIALLGLGDIAGGLRGGSLGIGGVSLLQALALSRSHTASLRRTDHLNAQLQARVELLEANNQEIRVLNEELRRQVEGRSQHLADALARLGPVFARPRDFENDEVIDARYRVVRRIGEGGMGTVYEVARLADGRRLALKVLQGQRSGAELSRLAQEAEIASRIDHPNVVAMVDVDVSASGAVFLVMEYVDGASLDDLADRYGQAPWALGVLRQIAEGLAVLHAKDIVHRDLKPGNVLVTRDAAGGDLAKIADFGIATRAGGSDDPRRSPAADATAAPIDDVSAARTSEEAPAAKSAATPPAITATTDRSLTRTGQILGTPLYMAPELARGAKYASAASDVYAVGVMAFELLTGEPPSGHKTLEHLRPGARASVSFTGRAAGLTPALVTLFERCLDRDPAARPTARELAGALSC